MHSPDQAGPPSGLSALSSLGEGSDLMSLSAFAPTKLGFRLDWTGAYYTQTARMEYSRALFEYIVRSTGGWL